MAPAQRRGPSGKGGAHKAENNRIYAHPLPLVFVQPDDTRHVSTHRVLGLFGISGVRVENPHCEGTLDPATRSVWVTDRKDAMILWQRGFFGKGDLSRSEPSWYTRQVNARKAAGKYMTSEEIREKRRKERQQFKIDRARAMAEAAAEAERAFAEGREAATIAIPSGATWKPQPGSSADIALPSEAAEPEDHEDDPVEEEPLEDVEHLQLTLQEAFFLLWNLDCLTIIDPSSDEPLDLQRIWFAFQQAHWPPGIPPSLSSVYESRFDNPFLVHYVAYHHYRALGWVVKGGIKFCVDYLLYKRGPVFSHAEFAVVVLPVYEDPEEQKTSPFNLTNAEPFSWTWLSTVNRVNSQVQKTLILTYVTIPARSRIDPQILESPAALAHYSVRDVVLRRFIPARMRD
ncbi:tRNA intron endonuclease domain-containing protein [Phanerochaete sordida]|uniref:tRNA-splicing endonuclease subunit Sen2 n=1 Tax=Phanerochaete sordida TaxID=48140 RepID=A0A9P3GA63_9APHY|nr:tRNA intron endonuclease domain-containing protein [Phanerochaete sordida]